jgi:hypothetical protein
MAKLIAPGPDTPMIRRAAERGLFNTPGKWHIAAGEQMTMCQTLLWSNVERALLKNCKAKDICAWCWPFRVDENNYQLGLFDERTTE